MPDSIVIRLTQAELHLLKHSLAIETLPGIAFDLLVGLSEDQRKEAVKLAEQTLRARCFVIWGRNGQHAIDPAVANLLLDYAHPGSTLFVDTALPSGRVVPFLYVFGARCTYEQCQPEPDIVQFRVFADRDELVQRLTPQLPEEQPADPEQWRGQIQQRLLNKALHFAQQDEQAACGILATVLPLELAEALTASYHSPQVIQYLARWQGVPTQEHREPRAALTILQGPEHAFLLWVEHPEQGEKSLVRVHPFFGIALSNYLEQVVPPVSLQIDPSKLSLAAGHAMYRLSLGDLAKVSPEKVKPS